MARPTAEFSLDPSLSTGLSSWCKTCQRNATKASRERYRERYNRQRRKPKQSKRCELCGEDFETAREAKRFCWERCQRTAEKRRFRERHLEAATCKGCGRAFERETTTNRPKVYCTLDCQAASGAWSTGARPDIQAGIRRALVSKRVQRGGR